MFQVTEGKGFWMSFPNGWGISVQFGPGNYGDHYGDARSDRAEPGGPVHAAVTGGVYSSGRAEVAIIHNDGRWFDFEENAPTTRCPVLAYKSPAEVAAVIARVVAL